MLRRSCCGAFPDAAVDPDCGRSCGGGRPDTASILLRRRPCCWGRLGGPPKPALRRRRSCSGVPATPRCATVEASSLLARRCDSAPRSMLCEAGFWHELTGPSSRLPYAAQIALPVVPMQRRDGSNRGHNWTVVESTSGKRTPPPSSFVPPNGLCGEVMIVQARPQAARCCTATDLRDEIAAQHPMSLRYQVHHRTHAASGSIAYVAQTAVRSAVLVPHQLHQQSPP